MTWNLRLNQHKNSHWYLHKIWYQIHAKIVFDDYIKFPRCWLLCCQQNSYKTYCCLSIPKVLICDSEYDVFSDKITPNLAFRSRRCCDLKMPRFSNKYLSRSQTQLFQITELMGGSKSGWWILFIGFCFSYFQFHSFDLCCVSFVIFLLSLLFGRT